MRRVSLRVVAITLSFGLSLVAAEAVLRATGYTAVVPTSSNERRAAIHQPDASLGWWNKPGRFTWGSGANAIEYRFLLSGARATGASNERRKHLAIVVGGSFTQGWGLSDHKTYPWKLQAAIPELEVVNLGSAGYGTYQSLLAAERFLAGLDRKPDLIVYGFNLHHQARNVASASWLEGMSRASDAGPVSVPFATLGGADELVRHPPLGYPIWPLRESLSTVAFLESRYNTFRSRGREVDMVALTRRLILELDRLGEEHGAHLVVAGLAACETCDAQMRAYLDFSRSRGILAVDCQHPRFHEKSMRVPGVGHPNETINDHWAKCLEPVMVPVLSHRQ